MNKRALMAAASVLACFTLAGCGGGDQGPNESTPAAPAPTPSASTAPSQASAPAIPGNSCAADLSDCRVELKNVTLTDDYEGAPAIIVTYAWTNNSTETTSSMTSVSCSAYQDGSELGIAVIMDEGAYDAEAFMQNIDPGEALDVQAAFVLDNTTSTVEIQLREWNSHKDDPPAVSLEVSPDEL